MFPENFGFLFLGRKVFGKTDSEKCPKTRFRDIFQNTFFFTENKNPKRTNSQIPNFKHLKAKSLDIMHAFVNIINLLPPQVFSQSCSHLFAYLKQMLEERILRTRYKWIEPKVAKVSIYLTSISIL